MASPLLLLKDIGLSFGEKTLFENLDISIFKGDKISLVGRNGAGKSTLLKVIAGIIEPDLGSRSVQTACRATYMAQEPDFSKFTNLNEFVLSSLSEEERLSLAFDHIAEIMAEELELDLKREPKKCSGGEKRKAALIKAILPCPDLLLFDEPTNHLDITSIEWLENKLKTFNGAIIVISHDKAFLKNLTDHTFWLDRGMVRSLDKGFEFFEEWQEQVLADEELERHKFDRLIESEMSWLHKGVTARRKRNMGRLRRLKEMREVRRNQIKTPQNVKIEISSGETSGKIAIEATGVSKSYGDRNLINNFTTRILRGNKIGIIGKNGIGKSTLIKILCGDVIPDTGNVKLGTNLTPVYIDQNRAELDEGKNIWEILCDKNDQINVRGTYRHVVGYMKDFLFDPAMAKTPVKALSGGERNRLLLAKHLAKETNLLILDEPTNDLDIETLELLEDVLSEYDGTLLLISHDRDFLDAIVESTIVFEGNGKITEYCGGYSDYLIQRNNIEEPSKKATPTKTASEKPQNDVQPKAKTKLSFNEKRDLEILPKKIEELQAKLTDLEKELSDPNLFNKSPDKFNQYTEDMSKYQEELDKAEERWLELEILKEELGL